MVNFHDPVVIAKEQGVCAQYSLSKSEGNWAYLPGEVLRFWNLVDGIFMWARLYWHFAVPMCHITQSPTPSWEFMISLDYEWSVIRGCRPYRWTIWV